MREWIRQRIPIPNGHQSITPQSAVQRFSCSFNIAPPKTQPHDSQMTSTTPPKASIYLALLDAAVAGF